MWAQSLTFSTLAGHGGPGAADGVRNSAGFNSLFGVAADTNGNLYVADTANHTVRKITPLGVVSTLAGLAGVKGSADGTNSSALFNEPRGLAVDGTGVVYVADTGNHTIRKIIPAGATTTFAGYPGLSGSGNGLGTNAQFFHPEGVALDTLGNVYVADTWNHTIRKITVAGLVATFAGMPGVSGTNDATGSSARFFEPSGVAVDKLGTLYVADSGNHTIRRCTAAASVSTLAGSALNCGSVDGLGTSALFHQPQSVAVDGVGYVYVADFWNQTIRQVSPGGAVVTITGLATNRGSADGLNANARFWAPAGVAVPSPKDYTIYVADSGNGTVRKIVPSDSDWAVSTVAGFSSAGSSNGIQLTALFSSPAGIAVDTAGNAFVADTLNHVIRKVTASGMVTTFAGSAGNPGSADGSGTSARFYAPQAIAVDSAGFVYVADTLNHAIRKITAAGTVSTLAGLAGVAGAFDGSGASARFYNPQALTVDNSGTVYVADTFNHLIRKITSGGTVTTLAGVVGNYGAVNDGANGTTNRARFYYPAGVTVDGSGNLYVADSFKHLIRKVTPSGISSTLAGTPGVWGSSDGTNSTGRFFNPQGIVVDGSGVLFVMDSGNHALRRVAPSGTNWVVTTVAGLPGVSGSSNGTGSANRFKYSAGLALDAAGNLYVADAGNNAIRVSRIVIPLLHYVREGDQGSVFWSASGYNFLPETSASLSSGWTLVNSNVVTPGDVSVLNFTSGNPAGFYRLHKP